MKRATLIAVLLWLALLMPASATTPAAHCWFQPAHSGKNYVNPYLTPQRVIGKPAEPSWNGQLVLWQGRIRSQSVDGRNTSLQLDTGSGIVPVDYHWKAINLETDRTGYRVAVKGDLLVSDGHVLGLQGHSLILLHPPANLDFDEFMKTEPLRRVNVETFLSWWIGFHNATYAPAERDMIAHSLVVEAEAQHLDPLFLASLVQIESAFRVDAVSPSGAIGLGQLMPFVARGYGVDPHDPQQNLHASARMIGRLVHSWGAGRNAYALALAGYNAGPTLVRRCGAVPAIPQTTNYVYFIGYVHQEMTAAATRLGVLPVAVEATRH